MAVMARALGIPSRVVLGFTPGSPLDDGRIVVRDRNSHAWVELWMPTQGWVRFDPTPRGDGINPATIENLPFDVEEYIEIPEADLPELDLSGPDPFILLGEDPLDDIPRFAGAGGGEDAIPTPTLPGRPMTTAVKRPAHAMRQSPAKMMTGSPRWAASCANTGSTNCRRSSTCFAAR